RGNFEGPKGTVMNGRYYSPRYDRRHDISIVAMYEINRRLTASATWVYGSGDLTWLPRGRYSFQDVYGGNAQTFVPVYGDRNDIRLPDFHRLDLNFIIKFFPKWGESDLTISVVNAYDRRNAFFIYIEPQYADDNNNSSGNEFDIPERLAAKQVSLFPILPALTWNFKF